MTRATLLLLAAASAWCRLGAGPDTRGVGVYEARLTLGQDDGGTLVSVERGGGPDVHYRVTLKDVPAGASLALGCDWIDPNGTVAHQNRYVTRPADKSVWPTQCHHLFGPAALSGVWSVRMSLAGRALVTTPFTVR